MYSKSDCPLFPFRAFVLPLQELNGVNSKLDAPPLSGHAGISPATQIGGNSLQYYPSFAGETIGTRIDRDNSLIMPPSFVRQLRNNTAQSDGTTVKLGAHILAALRLAL